MYQRKGCAWLFTSPNNIRSEWTAASLTAARQGRFVVDKVTVAVARVHALPGQGACSVQETLSAGERPGEKPGGDRNVHRLFLQIGMTVGPGRGPRDADRNS